MTNPMGIGFALAIGGLMAGLWRGRCTEASAAGHPKAGRLGWWLVGLGVVWLWAWSTPLLGRLTGGALERPWLVGGQVPRVEHFARATAIVLHGGSMGSDSEMGGEGEMWSSADRVWMAAKLWKAGCAPVIFATGGGVRASTAGLLRDFGVPEDAVVFAEGPRNTEEEAKWVGRSGAAAARFDVLRCGTDMRLAECSAPASGLAHVGHRKNLRASAAPSRLGFENDMRRANCEGERPRVLVVTSAWHMTRTMMLYAKYAPGVEAIAAPCDFENTLRTAGGFSWTELLPSDEAMMANRVALHEWVGIAGYKWVRR